MQIDNTDFLGHGPVVDLVKDTKNAELVSAVRLPPLLWYIPVISGTLTIECPILIVLGGRRIGRWRLPWARVSTLRFAEAPLQTLTRNHSSAFILAKDSDGKSIFEGRRATCLSNAEEEAHGLPLEVSSRLQPTVTSVDNTTTLGYRFLFGGQDQRARGEI